MSVTINEKSFKVPEEVELYIKELEAKVSGLEADIEKRLVALESKVQKWLKVKAIDIEHGMGIGVEDVEKLFKGFLKKAVKKPSPPPITPSK